MAMELTNRGVFILAGGAGAVAGAVGEVFHEAGARLVLAGPNESGLKPRADRWSALAVTADLSSAEGARLVVEETLRTYGRMDGLIHTVGGFAMAPAAETSEELFHRMMGLNVRTLFCTVRAVLPHLLRQGDGFIAGISAGLALGAGGAGMTAYAAAKGAVRGYLRALADEVRPQGIRVAVVYPMGAIDTPQNRQAMPGQDPAGWIDPLEIGRALLFASTREVRGDLQELVLGVRGGRPRG
jgi:NAD(P)-dependent dehydrogenase (short-subunit alcohol dehydrogenase family)